jgi:hypothetical protein
MLMLHASCFMLHAHAHAHAHASCLCSCSCSFSCSCSCFMLMLMLMLHAHASCFMLHAYAHAHVIHDVCMWGSLQSPKAPSYWRNSLSLKVCLYCMQWRKSSVTVTVTATVTDSLFKHWLQKSPALPPSCPDYYADLFRAPLSPAPHSKVMV